MQYEFFGYFLSATLIVFTALIVWFGQQFMQNRRLAKRLEKIRTGLKG
ncbi:MAG: hypothetical protein GXO90_00215 [FCB group bacterium]|nr:hypothetical protein [FCB group bacterium]